MSVTDSENILTSSLYENPSADDECPSNDTNADGVKLTKSHHWRLRTQSEMSLDGSIGGSPSSSSDADLNSTKDDSQLISELAAKDFIDYKGPSIDDILREHNVLDEDSHSKIVERPYEDTTDHIKENARYTAEMDQNEDPYKSFIFEQDASLKDANDTNDVNDSNDVDDANDSPTTTGEDSSAPNISNQFRDLQVDKENKTNQDITVDDDITSEEILDNEEEENSDAEKVKEQANRLGVEPLLTRNNMPMSEVLRDPIIDNIIDVSGGTLAILKDGTILANDTADRKVSTVRNLLNRRGLSPKLIPTTKHVIRTIYDTAILEEAEAEEQKSASAARFDAGAIDSDISRYFETLVADALATSATDIHIEARESETIIKFRIDGRLIVHEKTSVRRALSLGYLLFNAMARRGAREFVVHKTLDAACNISVNGINCGLRIATAPEARGFDVMIRILSGAQQELALDALGYSDMHLQLMREAIDLPYGVLLMSGPVGSGKSTSLMSLVKEVNPVRKVISLEDPVEIVLGNVTHVPVAEHVEGATWDDLLRGLNRWDSNIIIAGEVRDQRTCAALQKMATSGRMVLSTLHASNCLAIPTRMEDLGSEFTMLYDPNFLSLIVNQRLVPKLCNLCKMVLPEAEDDMDTILIDRLREVFEDKYDQVYTRNPQGCPACREGMKGRALVCEAIRCDSIARRYIKDRNQDGWRKELKEMGWKDIADHAMSKIYSGDLDPLIVKDMVPLLEPQGSSAGFDYKQRQEKINEERRRKAA